MSRITMTSLYLLLQILAQNHAVSIVNIERDQSIDVVPVSTSDKLGASPAKSFYVSSTDEQASDSNSGTSPDKPWKTLARAAQQM